MSDTRRAQARDEAERWRKRPDGSSDFQHKVGCMKGFMQGVEWADAHPQPHTITLSQSEAILEAGRAGRYEDHEAALRAAGIEVDDAIDVPTHCAACGKPAEGFAMINDERFCHPDEGPSCYMGGRR